MIVFRDLPFYNAFGIIIASYAIDDCVWSGDVLRSHLFLHGSLGFQKVKSWSYVTSPYAYLFVLHNFDPNVSKSCGMATTPKV